MRTWNAAPAAGLLGLAAGFLAAAALSLLLHGRNGLLYLSLGGIVTVLSVSYTLWSGRPDAVYDVDPVDH